MARARKALDALNAKQKEQVATEEVMPGITRRQLTLIAGGGAFIQRRHSCASNVLPMCGAMRSSLRSPSTISRFIACVSLCM